MQNIQNKLSEKELEFLNRMKLVSGKNLPMYIALGATLCGAVWGLIILIQNKGQTECLIAFYFGITYLYAIQVRKVYRKILGIIEKIIM